MNGSSHAIPSRLRAALGGPLPGEAAHRVALPADFVPRWTSDPTGYRQAAVLIALFVHPDGDRVLFPLIRRPTSVARHAGQISLPGGEREPGESSEECAVREAFEEVGIDPDGIEILGRLSPIEVPVSLYLVDPFVAWLTAPPTFRLQDSEVRALLLADPERLAADGPKEYLTHTREGRTVRFPAWNVGGEKVWGATAMILGEFIEIWRRAR